MTAETTYQPMTEMSTIDLNDDGIRDDVSIDDRRAYPSEEKMVTSFNKFNVYTKAVIMSIVFVCIGLTIVYTGERCINEYKHNRLMKTNALIMISIFAASIIGDNTTYVWYKSTKLFAISTLYLVCWVITCGLIGYAWFLWKHTMCPLAIVIFHLLSIYHIAWSLMIVGVLVKYPKLLQRVVSNPNQLQSAGSLIPVDI